MKEHTHILSDGTVIKHSHTHKHTQTKAVLNRMAKIIGHAEAVKRMIEDGRDCSEVLIQLSAVDGAIKAVSKIILRDHMAHCIVDAVKTGDSKSIEDLNKAIEKLLK